MNFGLSLDFSVQLKVSLSENAEKAQLKAKSKVSHPLTTNCGQMVRDSAMGNAVLNGAIADPYDLSFPQKEGPKCTPLV